MGPLEVFCGGEQAVSVVGEHVERIAGVEEVVGWVGCEEGVVAD